MNSKITRRVRAAANRALIAGNAEYFSWSESDQEEFRASPGKNARLRMDQVLLKEVLGIKCDIGKVSKVWRGLSLDQLNKINAAVLLTSGIGVDFVFLNESLAEEQTLLDFDTLYDYDFDDFLFQEEWRHKDLKDYCSPGYFPLFHPRWIRLIMREELVYGNLYSLAGYVLSYIEDEGDKFLDRYIPSTYVEGPDHGKKVDKGVLWDYRLEADGREPQLKELRMRWWKYQQSREQQLQKEFANLLPNSWIFEDKSDFPDESSFNFVICNEKTMRRIHWKTILTDFRTYEGNPDHVKHFIEREIEYALDFLDSQIKDVMDNFVPPDIEAGKKRKLIMSSGALDDLEHLSRDESPE